jgi:acyl carrier protein
MNTVEELKQLIHREYDIAIDTIDADAPFSSYNVDSLTLAEMIFAIEDQYQVTVPDTASTEVTTLAGMAALLDKLVAQKTAG